MVLIEVPIMRISLKALQRLFLTHRPYLKRFFLKLFVSLVVILLYQGIWYMENGEKIKEGEQALYNNIPNIKVYNSEVLLKDSITITGRTPTQILGKGRFIIPESSSSNMVREYYKQALSEYGWKEIKKEKIMDNANQHYGDEIIFRNEEYEIALDVYPPLDTTWDTFTTSLYLDNQEPYYYIYAEKQDKRLFSRE